MDTLLAASEAERSFVLILFEVFGIVALLLAATGIYGVLSGSVNERMREIGVRSALGATRGDIVALVVRQAIDAHGSRGRHRTRWSGSRHPRPDHAVVRRLTARPNNIPWRSRVLLSASLIACWVPAWRAARVDPSITLRAE